MMTSYKVMVDYSMSLEDMIAAGKYDFVNGYITTTNFPIDREETGKEDVEVILVCLGESLTTEQVKSEFYRRGLKPATIMELLALGASHPELQREFSILALGSSLRNRGHLYFPYLYTIVDGRGLDLDWFDTGLKFGELWRYLTVRK